MPIRVQILKGRYRGVDVTGVFNLVQPWKDGANGGFITIYNPDAKQGHPNSQRVTCARDGFKLIDDAGNEVSEQSVVDAAASKKEAGAASISGNTSFDVVQCYEQEFIEGETDEEAMERIAKTFTRLDRITDKCAQGTIRGLVVTGPPGVGKSHGVEETLKKHNMFKIMAGKEPDFEIVSGGVSSIGLYQKLFYNKDAGRVLVFDDCDGILFDEESLSLLKAALNSGNRRRICWNKESRILRQDEIPDFFDFEGSVIFISNVDFERTIARGSRIASHLAAIISRCHYMDLAIGSLRDQILRIRQVIRDGMLTQFDFHPQQALEVQDFVINNKEFLREVSLRMVIKVAQLVKSDPDDWHELAEDTCLTKEAKFKRLLAKREADNAAATETESPATEEQS